MYMNKFFIAVNNLPIFLLGMKTGMKGTERLLMTSRKRPQTVKTGQCIPLQKNAKSTKHMCGGLC